MTTIKGINVHIITSATTGILTEMTVETDNRDRIRWELACKREKWPTPTEAPFLWATYLAYAALKRSGELPSGMTFEEFSDATSHAEAAAVDVDPTQLAIAAD